MAVASRRVAYPRLGDCTVNQETLTQYLSVPAQAGDTLASTLMRQQRAGGVAKGARIAWHICWWPRVSDLVRRVSHDRRVSGSVHSVGDFHAMCAVCARARHAPCGALASYDRYLAKELLPHAMG